MDDRSASYLIAVALEGSLRAAADKLGMTQPALSKSMRRLEDELDVRLLDRTARGVTLTVYGETVLRHARAIRASVRETHDEIAALKKGVGGRVRVGAGPSWQRSVLPAAVAAFRADWPRVNLEIIGGMDDQLKARLRSGELDMVLAAMAGPQPTEPDLMGHALIEDEYGVVARASHPLAAEQTPIPLTALTGWAWILPGRQSMLALRLAAIFQAQGLPVPDAIIETDINPLKMRLMLEGDYLSFHALGQLRESEPGPILPLGVPEARWRRAAGIMTRRGAESSPAAQAMATAIETACKRPKPLTSDKT